MGVGLRAIVVACVALQLAACGAKPVPRTVSLRLRGVPPNATVTIDDQFVGSLDFVAAHGVALPLGTHHISVEAPGFLPWDNVVVSNESSKRIRLDVALRKIPD
jgi:hypothetical protein